MQQMSFPEKITEAERFSNSPKITGLVCVRIRQPGSKNPSYDHNTHC
jgi:hypothetical protein